MCVIIPCALPYRDLRFSCFSAITYHSPNQVTATDGDKDRPQNIVYFLTGQGIDPDNPANSKFDINRTSGEIFVLKVNGRLAPSPVCFGVEDYYDFRSSLVRF